MIFVPFQGLSPSTAKSIPTPKKGSESSRPLLFSLFLRPITSYINAIRGIIPACTEPTQSAFTGGLPFPQQPKSLRCHLTKLGNHHRRHISTDHIPRVYKKQPAFSPSPLVLSAQSKAHHSFHCPLSTRHSQNCKMILRMRRI